MGQDHRSPPLPREVFRWPQGPSYPGILQLLTLFPGTCSQPTWWKPHSNRWVGPRAMEGWAGRASLGPTREWQACPASLPVPGVGTLQGEVVGGTGSLEPPVATLLPWVPTFHEEELWGWREAPAECLLCPRLHLCSHTPSPSVLIITLPWGRASPSPGWGIWGSGGLKDLPKVIPLVNGRASRWTQTCLRLSLFSLSF